MAHTRTLHLLRYPRETTIFILWFFVWYRKNNKEGKILCLIVRKLLEFDWMYQNLAKKFVMRPGVWIKVEKLVERRLGFEQKLAHLVGPGHMAYLWPTHGLPSKAKNRNIGSMIINYRPGNDNTMIISDYTMIITKRIMIIMPLHQ